MKGEKLYEHKLVEECKKLNCLAIKQTAEYHRGIPDRLILRPDGYIEWVEVKSDGKKPTKIQALFHQKLTAMCFPVYVVDSKESLEEYIIGLGQRLIETL